jgi:hypothetical protein
VEKLYEARVGAERVGHGFGTEVDEAIGAFIVSAVQKVEVWSAKIPSCGFQRNVTLLHSDRLPSEALCCGKIPSYFEALTDPRDKPSA